MIIKDHINQCYIFFIKNYKENICGKIDLFKYVNDYRQIITNFLV
jgi:hypothetical protein